MSYANAANKGAQTNTPDAVPFLRFTNNNKPKNKGKKDKKQQQQPQQQKEKPKEKIYIEPEKIQVHKSVTASFPEPDKTCAGPFQTFDRDILFRLAYWSDADVCALGATCKYLKKMLLTPKILKFVGRYPEVQRPVIKVKLQVGSPDDTIADDEIDESSVQTLPIQSFAPESRVVILANYWLKLAKDAQNEREKALEAEKKKDFDMTTYKKPTLHLNLVGGFYIESLLNDKGNKVASNARVAPNKLFNSVSVTQIPSWLEGISHFLAGESEVVLKAANGDVKLERTGYGNCVKFTWKDETGASKNVCFPLSRFCLNFRTAAKDYLNVVERVIQYIQQKGQSMTIPQNENKKEEAEKKKTLYLERERLITSLLLHTKLVGCIKDLKNLLRVGAIPGAELGKFFARRKEEKARFKKQMEIEYNDMNAFILSNLPKDLAAVESQAVKLTDAIKKKEIERIQAENDRRKSNDAFKQQLKEKEKTLMPAKKKETVIVGANIRKAREDQEKIFQENPAKRDEFEKKQLEEKRKKLQEEAEQLRLKEESRIKKKTVKVNENGWVVEKTQIIIGDKPVEEEKPKGKKKKNQKAQQQQVQQPKKKVDPAVQLERDIEKIAQLNPFAVAEGVTGEDITDELYELNYNKGRERGEFNNLVAKELLKKQKKQKPQPQQNKPNQPNKPNQQNKPKAKPQNQQKQNQPTKQLTRKPGNQKSFSVVGYLENTQLIVGAGLVAALVLVYSVVIGGF